MTIIVEIANWIGQQPAWVSDAARRLFFQGELTLSDVDDSVAMAKASFGIKDSKNRIPVPLDLKSVPQKKPDQPPVKITAISEINFVNAISNSNGISFASSGITTIYGYNGAGKSGYGRILKKVCRARQAEQIYPNIFEDSPVVGSAQATVEWCSGAVGHKDVWTDTDSPPEELGRIAVFDSHCARTLLDDNAEVFYIPYGLDILRDLAFHLQQVQKKIELETAAIKFEWSKLDELRGETQVGRLIAALNHSSDLANFEMIAKLSEEENDERVMLGKLLGEEDPVKVAASMRRFATRLQALDGELDMLAHPLSNENVNALDGLFQKLKTAEQAAELASSILLDEGKALPGTGTEPWQLLLRSAIDFATETVYPGEAFPGPEYDSQCVLCQQPLAADAQARLKKFVDYLQSDAQRQISDYRNQAKVLYRAIAGLELVTFPSDATILEELEERYPELACSIDEFLSALKESKKYVMNMAVSKSLAGIANLPYGPSTEILHIVAMIRKEAGQLDTQMTQEIRTAKTKRLAELNARRKLGELLGVISDAISSLKVEHSYSEAGRTCSTVGITRKMTDLYNQAVTVELQAALFQECAVLGVRSELLGLDMLGQKGVRLQKLKLAASPKFAKIKPSLVLSEGEQRAVALAAFLAEINVEGDSSGVVFDDPVSSLDQIRKERIALRLVGEAKKRQVIVFTHDLAFAWSLRELAEGHGVSHEERFVFKTEDSAGNVQDNFPFEAKKIPSRVNELKDYAAKARKTLDADKNFDAYNDTARQLYRRMRDTWELAVEDLLFNGSVKRFKRSINTQQLLKVEVNDCDIKEISEGMTRCSMFTHEGGAEDPPPLPTPDDLDIDLNVLAATVSRLKNRLDEVEKRRKENGISA
ncbi:AAA family ATPase [Undibacterium sp. TC4M20W]|uniref:AAA family ATPase n=1 Tax=Undibacterium sp. TC4M20W TaxID=3413052 RepID=UPI003BF13366